jgi:hypothetical protein
MLSTPAAFGKIRQITKRFPESANEKFNYFEGELDKNLP